MGSHEALAEHLFETPEIPDSLNDDDDAVNRDVLVEQSFETPEIPDNLSDVDDTVHHQVIEPDRKMPDGHPTDLSSMTEKEWKGVEDVCPYMGKIALEDPEKFQKIKHDSIMIDARTNDFAEKMRAKYAKPKPEKVLEEGERVYPEVVDLKRRVANKVEEVVEKVAVVHEQPAVYEERQLAAVLEEVVVQSMANDFEERSRAPEVVAEEVKRDVVVQVAAVQDEVAPQIVVRERVGMVEAVDDETLIPAAVRSPDVVVETIIDDKRTLERDVGIEQDEITQERLMVTPIEEVQMMESVRQPERVTVVDDVVLESAPTVEVVRPVAEYEIDDIREVVLMTEQSDVSVIDQNVELYPVVQVDREKSNVEVQHIVDEAESLELPLSPSTPLSPDENLQIVSEDAHGLVSEDLILEFEDADVLDAAKVHSDIQIDALPIALPAKSEAVTEAPLGAETITGVFFEEKASVEDAGLAVSAVEHDVAEIIEQEEADFLPVYEELQADFVETEEYVEPPVVRQAVWRLERVLAEPLMIVDDEVSPAQVEFRQVVRALVVELAERPKLQLEEAEENVHDSAESDADTEGLELEKTWRTPEVLARAGELKVLLERQVDGELELTDMEVQSVKELLEVLNQICNVTIDNRPEFVRVDDVTATAQDSPVLSRIGAMIFGLIGSKTFAFGPDAIIR